MRLLSCKFERMFPIRAVVLVASSRGPRSRDEDKEFCLLADARENASVDDLRGMLGP